MKGKQQLNSLKKREFILSPTVSSGKDKECTSKEFIQNTDVSTEYVGKLGSGTKVIFRDTDIHYTIKTVPKEKVIKLNMEKKVNRILELMYQAVHPYLIRLLNHFEDDERLYLILESSDGESLYSKLSTMPDDIILLKYFIEILIGVKHLQSYDIFNINVNPDMIIIDSDNLVKLTDYGWNMSNPIPNARQTFVLANGITVNSYTSPEELNAIRKKTKPVYTHKKDSWNLGVLLYEMFSFGNPPFKGNTMDEFAQNILDCNYDLSIIPNPEVKKLISQLLVFDEKKRMSIDDLLKYDYFINIEIDIPEIEANDSILHFVQKEEEDLKKKVIEMDMHVNNYDYDTMMTSLRFENEELKKKLDSYRQSELMMNDDIWKQSMAMGKNTSSSHKKDSQSLDDEEFEKMRLKIRENGLSETEIEDKESFLDEKLRMLEQDNGDLDEDINLNSEIRQLENQIEILKSHHDEQKERNDELKKSIIQKEQQNIILEQKVSNSNYDDSSDNKHNTSLVSIVSSIQESLGSFKDLAYKLISLSIEDQGNLMDKADLFLNGKSSLMIDLLTSMKEDNLLLGNETNRKKDIGSFECKQSQIEELIDYTAKLTALELKESKLMDQIKIYEEKNKMYEQMNEVYISKYQCVERMNNDLLINKRRTIGYFQKIKEYVNIHHKEIGDNFLQDFYLEFKI